MPIVITKAKVATNHPVLRVAERLDGKLKQAFLDAVQSVKDGVTLKELKAAIELGDASQVIQLLQIDQRFTEAMQGKGIKANTASVRQAVQQVYREGAEATYGMLPQRVSMEMSFNLLNQNAVQFLQSYDFGLIQGISSESRAAVQQAVMRGFKEGQAPTAMARYIRSSIGLTTTQELAVWNYRQALEAGTGAGLRSALSRSLRDGRYDSSLLNALANNRDIAPTRIDRMVDRYAERYLSYRANTIARSESIRASVAGQRELWRQAQEQGLLDYDVKRRWITSMDERECRVCAGLNGMEVGLDEEFDKGIMQPPDPHPSCRCTVALAA